MIKAKTTMAMAIVDGSSNDSVYLFILSLVIGTSDDAWQRQDQHALTRMEDGKTARKKLKLLRETC